MKFNNLLSATLFAGLFTMVSCSQEELGGQPQNDGKNYLQITVTDTGVFGDSPTRAVEDGYKTTFEAGDMIGVYGLKSGSMVVENHKFTYKEDGTWESNGRGIEFIEEDMEEMKFYAYYPYQPQGVKFNSKAGLQGDPFAETVSGWEVGTDFDENYTNYDLMTSGIAEITSTGALGVINFKLKHRMSIAAIELPGKVYNFTNADPEVEPYKLPAVPGEFKVHQGEDKIVKPYYDKKNDLYRILVKPGIEYKVSGTYTLEKRMDFESNAVTGQEGKARRFKLKGSIVTEHNLQVGDYYCADGSIVAAKDIAPKNAIGVVYYVGNPQPSNLYDYTEYQDIMRYDYPNCKHGLIVALNNAGGDKTYKFSNSKNLFIDTWKDNVYDEGGRYINVTSGGKTKPQIKMLGYNNTKLMLMSQNDATIKGRSDVMCEVLSSYVQANPTPSMSTSWFCPSLGDFNTMLKKYSIIESSIKEAEGSLNQCDIAGNMAKDNGAYWTSSVRNESAQFIFGFNAVEEDGEKGYAVTNNAGGTMQHFRFCLAF